MKYLGTIEKNMDGQTGLYFTLILAHVVVVLHVLLLTHLSYGQDDFMLVTAPYNRTIYYFRPGSFIPASLPVSISGEPLAIGYDPVESRVYWTERYNGIFSAFLNDTDKIVLPVYSTSSDLQSYGLAVDHISRLVFYTDQPNRLIAMISITTLDHKLLVNTHLDEPRDIVLDIMNGVMFWSDIGFNKIERANYDGSDRRHIVNTSLIWPMCLALDVSNGFLYWADTMMQRLERCSLDGQDRTLLVEFTAYRVFLGLTFDGENLYLIDSPARFLNDTGQNFIQQISTDGNNITQVFNDTHLLFSIYIWSTNLEIGPNGCGNNNGGCSHMCLPLPGNTSKCTCPDGKNCSLDLHIYNHLGLAVDHISRLVFYTDQPNGLIATISITTLDHKLLVNTDLVEPRDIVLDIINGVMFWTDTGFHKIERANYDGSDRRHIVNTSLIWPICIALDVSNGFLYWADTMMQRLERCNLDGQDRKLLVEFTAYSILLGLAFDGENLFLVDSPAGFINATGQNFIQRISTDGYNITEVFKDFHLLDDVYIWSSNNSQIGSNGCGNNNGGCSHMCLPLPGNTRKCTCPDGKNCSLENVTDTNSFNNNIVYLDDGRKEYSFFTLTLCL